jgi:hypothetical protein
MTEKQKEKIRKLENRLQSILESLFDIQREIKMIIANQK